MARHCAVTGCPNGDFQLNRWRKDWCKVFNGLNSNLPCSCEPQFQLFSFSIFNLFSFSLLLFYNSRKIKEQLCQKEDQLWILTML